VQLIFQSFSSWNRQIQHQQIFQHATTLPQSLFLPGQSIKRVNSESKTLEINVAEWQWGESSVSSFQEQTRDQQPISVHYLMRYLNKYQGSNFWCGSTRYLARPILHLFVFENQSCTDLISKIYQHASLLTIIQGKWIECECRPIHSFILSAHAHSTFRKHVNKCYGFTT
jgi:hypothetical protein